MDVIVIVAAIATFATTSAFNVTNITFVPTFGPVGSIVSFTGADFTTASSVLFNGQAEVINYQASNAMTVSIGATVSSGYIRITTGVGNFTTVNPFNVTNITFAPTFGPVGTIVTFTGADFRTTVNCSFNNVLATIINTSLNNLIAIVNIGTTSGTVTIATDSVGTFITNGAFNVTTIGFSPSNGPIGQIVNITGADFTTASSVTFNGVFATIQSHVSNFLVCTVQPSSTNGTIVITTGVGTFVSGSSFAVNALPFTPAFGPIGTQVTFTGMNFGSTLYCAFNGVNATIISANNTTEESVNRAWISSICFSSSAFCAASISAASVFILINVFS